MRWKVVSKRLREFQKCIVLPIGNLSMGLCRHRAILFKVTMHGFDLCLIFTLFISLALTMQIIRCLFIDNINL